MNAAQAKQIQITDYLNIQANKNDIFIKSPFNPTEKTPSFKINTQKNIWYDHARGEGGNILDLVMQLHNYTLKQALEHLEKDNFSFSQANFTPAPAPSKEKTTEIKKIQDIQNQALIDYLRKRKIKRYDNFLREIYYTQNNKPYFALAFKNDSNGYEIRNEYFKGCVGKKDITTINNPDSTKLLVFEGFMDFLSALTYYQINTFKNDVIILNSVANKKSIIPLLKNYKKIYLFLDNDTAGNQTKQDLYKADNNCIDCSNIYKNFNDFNDFLQSL